ncbi:PhzF family phenazine biosynthesis protein [Kineococcus xinjiangensis]|uniref:PhzF family phenazine biosynthesis protein n=1 Tax=Kineococcus xinjiangensis TaxID=512762 RepID=A0A2S6ISU6_9ACTN|nr:PhzF family phenazine biosynthesis isomerase [Kineococcus xinjiangensis]PPK97323.1 PhzF family phenazine biosynthesis protein [Kineococcus xinjiangensis]
MHSPTADHPVAVPVLRMTAFPAGPGGGNPAGVVLDATGLPDALMQEVAARVGYSETAFLTAPPTSLRPDRAGIRYFSPVAEVPFCGHATIATAVALAQRDGPGTTVFETPVGEVEIRTVAGPDGPTASFTSREPRVDDLDDAVLQRLLGLLGLTAADLHPDLPPRLAFAGNVHPVVVLAHREAFDAFSFDPTAVRALMDEQGWRATVTVVLPLDERDFEARNLFPVGTLSEDPATGSAAASLGGYLRTLRPGSAPFRFTVHQGRHVGRPSLIAVDVPARGGIVVSGTATLLAHDG